jgi:integrase
MTKKKSKGNGQGSVYPRKNRHGKIIGYLGAYHGPDGKRRYVSAKSKSECERKLRAAMADADKGLVFDAGTITVGQYLTGWLRSIEGTVSERTYLGYAQMVNKHITPTIGKNRLKNLTPNHVRSVYKQKQQSLSPRTIQYIHVTLHKALKQAVLDGLLPRNVTDAVRPPKVVRDEVRPLSQDEARKLLAAARGERLEALYIVALHTGLRQGELLRLRWSDLDRDKLSVRGTKSQGSRRVIRLSQTALEALRSHRKRQLEEQLRATDCEDSGLIFATQSGKQMDRHNLWRQFKRQLKRADLPDIPFHNLRHTCATILFQRGTHPKLVQQLLGHASIKITLDTYSHYIEGYDGGLGDTMDEALG